MTQQEKSLLIEDSDGVLCVTLNRPGARNAMTLEMVTELTQALEAAEQSESLRIVLLRGAGGHFCAGADIKDFAMARTQPVTAERNPVAEVNAAFGRMCLALSRCSLPTVAAVEGAVLGGGFGLACASDITIAASNTMFGLPETSIGVVPAQIAPFLVERLGYGQAKRLALSGGKIPADQALSIGLVHEVHAQGEAFEAGIVAILNRLLSCAPLATRATKRLMLRARTEAPESLIDHAASVFAAALTSAEGAEGTMSFIQKRPPAWKKTRS